jgi:hypothetical protein
MAIRASHILSSLLFACAGAAAHAAELGDARVLSHIGQQLVADVELTLVEDAAAPVGVRLAHPDVYRGANIAMPPVLASLHLGVMRRDGRQFLHLTTSKPVESRMLHVYLELSDGGQRAVRLVTLWLTPDPNPAPPPLPVPAPVAVAAPAPIVAAPLPVKPEALRPVAAPRKPVPAARPAAALQAGEEYVEERATLRPMAAPMTAPIGARVRKIAPKAPVAPPAKAVKERKAAPVAPPPAPPKAQDAPAACAPQPAAEKLDACVALGKKNAALRHELGRIEEKVKVLQVAAGAAPAAAPVHAAAPAPKGAPRIQRKPKKEAPPEPEVELPWLLIGGALAAALALAGLVIALLRRRKRSRFGKIPKEHKPVKLAKTVKTPQPEAADGVPKPSFMSSVKARLMPGERRHSAPQPAGPQGENTQMASAEAAHE